MRFSILVALLLLLAFPVKANTSYLNPDAELLGEVNGETLQGTFDQLHKTIEEDGKKDVVLRISSPGGSVFAGLIFIQKIEDMKAKNNARIACVGDIMVASMASIIFESGVCDERSLTDRTVVLFHGVASEASGKTGNIQDELDLMRRIDLAGAKIVATRLGITPEQYLAKIDRRDWWLSPDEALAVGATDYVIAVGVPPNPRTPPAPKVEGPETAPRPAPAQPPPAPKPAKKKKKRAPVSPATKPQPAPVTPAASPPAPRPPPAARAWEFVKRLANDPRAGAATIVAGLVTLAVANRRRFRLK